MTPLREGFFPMRPEAGQPLTASNAAKLLRDLRGAWLIQPKACGHRVCAWIEGGAVRFWNRHGTLYSFAIHNAAAVRRLPAGTVLDCEAVRGELWPFEVLALAGRDLRAEPVEVRARLAEEVCQRYGLPWKFAEPSAAWLAAGCAGELPDFEGAVHKARGSSYKTLSNARHTSASWFKTKWR